MNKFFRFMFIFSISYLVLLWLVPPSSMQNKASITFQTQDSYTVWDLVTVKVENGTDSPVAFNSSCPNHYFKVFKNINWTKEDITNQLQIDDCKDLILNSKEERSIDFGKNNLKVFWSLADYKIIASTKDWKEFEANFKIVPEWFFSKLWNFLINRPIYNWLVWLIKYWPGMSLWFGIIMLTIIIRLLLLSPNYKALKNQKEMQKIQPELNRIKELYKWDQKRIAEETMKIWKKYNVSPMGSCLPMLIQFPILIALFLTIQNWLDENSSFLLYSFFQGFDFTLIKTNLFWILELTKPNIYVLPVIVWGLQYYQMRLTLWKIEDIKDHSGGAIQDQMQVMNKMMKYFLPLMITWVTATLPAAIWLYWGTSTIFSIVQQFYVNNKFPKQGKKIEEVEVVTWTTKKSGITTIRV